MDTPQEKRMRILIIGMCSECTWNNERTIYGKHCLHPNGSSHYFEPDYTTTPADCPLENDLHEHLQITRGINKAKHTFAFWTADGKYHEKISDGIQHLITQGKIHALRESDSLRKTKSNLPDNPNV